MKKQIRNWQARQGDVLIMAVRGLPEDKVPLQAKEGEIVLAEGELTGHNHAVVCDEAQAFTTADTADLWLRIGKRAKVVHPDHMGVKGKGFALGEGNYRSRRQVEYTPGAIRQVAD